MNDLYGTIDYDGESLINIRKLATLSSYSSDEWGSAYTTLSASSAIWQSTYGTVSALSGLWTAATSGISVSAAGVFTNVQYNKGGGKFGAVNEFSYIPAVSTLKVQNVALSSLSGFGINYFDTAIVTNAYITFNIGISSFSIPVVRF